MSGWAWSGTTGWVSFNCNDPKPGFPSGDCAEAGGDYGVDIVDTGGNIEGWAWSTEAGWICFGETCDGVVSPAAGTPTQDHYCSLTGGAVPGCARYDPGLGQVSGWAYIVGDNVSPFRGWISLNCTDVGTNTALPRNCGTGDYGVDFDEDTGNFSGFAWNGNGDTTGSGWLKWACDVVRPCAAGGAGDWGVHADWVNPGWDEMVQQQGVYTSSPAPATGSHLTSIPMEFMNFSAAGGSTLRCSLLPPTGPSIVVTTNIPATVSNVPVYTATAYTIQTTDPTADASGNPVLWQFGTRPGDLHTPPPWGCELTGASEIQNVVSNTIAVHPPGWTFTGPGGPTTSDSQRANFCLEGNLGTDPSRAYFQNAVQCDTEGDLAYTLLKAKGIKVELLCDDDGDDDLNYQKDCDGGIPVTDPDRSCRGITYLCITHPAAPSALPPAP